MIPDHIFREYDIRGLHATELTDEVAESVGRAFATLIAEGEPAGRRTVAVGRDVRPSSERLERSRGARHPRRRRARCERVGVVPTPALYYAVVARALDGGLQVTGSHNPPEFNGFKMTRAHAAAVRRRDPEPCASASSAATCARGSRRHGGRIARSSTTYARDAGRAAASAARAHGGHGLRQRLRRHRGARRCSSAWATA